MRSKTIWEAVVTVQSGRVPRLDFYGKADPYVRIYITTPRAQGLITVPTSCRTQAIKNAENPIWNETFAVPIMPDKELVVLKIWDSRAPLADGFIGLCMLPLNKLARDGAIWHGRLQVFNPGKSRSNRQVSTEITGSVDVAAKLISTQINLLEKEDLMSSDRRRSRRAPLEHRFLGVGELAAFYLDEGFSNDVNANWDQAVRILSEQLAYRLWEESGCTDDTKNYNDAKRQILEEGGLWDGH